MATDQSAVGLKGQSPQIIEATIAGTLRPFTDLDHRTCRLPACRTPCRIPAPTTTDE